MSVDRTSEQVKRFTPRSVPDSPGAFYQDDWDVYWNGLSEAEKQSLRDKAKWEHMTLSHVAMEWGAVDVVRHLDE